MIRARPAHAAAVLAACALACSAEDRRPPPPAASARAPPAAPSPRSSDHRGTETLSVTVKRVIDGDTILAEGLPGGTGLVRFTGIDAPETGEGRTTRECFGPEASRWLEARLPRGSPLRLVTDVAPRDRFGRLLAYAYAPDGSFLNAALVENGMARTMTIRPNVRHAKALDALQQSARDGRRGLWHACADAETPRRGGARGYSSRR